MNDRLLISVSRTADVSFLACILLLFGAKKLLLREEICWVLVRPVLLVPPPPDGAGSYGTGLFFISPKNLLVFCQA